MTRSTERGLIAVLLLVTSAYAIAEEITLTTYYPSPRGVYNQLKTMGQTTLAEQGGNVGVGTTAPTTKLDIVGGDMSLETGRSLRWGGVGGQTAIGGNSAANWINFSTAGAEKVRVDAAGNVGIGTTTPAAKLDVNGPVEFDNKTAGSLGLLNIRGLGSGIFYGAVNLVNGHTNQVWGLGFRQDTGNLVAGYLPSGANALEITQGNNVGIGTPSPNAAAPNGLPGNVDANDVYLRSISRWASQAGNYGGAYEYFFGGGPTQCPGPMAGVRVNNPFTGGPSCPAGFFPQELWVWDGFNNNCLVSCYR